MPKKRNCTDCGKICFGIRCKRCENIHRGFKECLCADCGKRIRCKHTRCKRCSLIYKWKTNPRQFNLPRTERKHNWKGGRTLANGYPAILMPEHPRARGGYVYEHILVWQQYHNRPLPKGWVIHHLNGVTTDNRPHNLVALPDKKHRHILAAKAKRIQELEGLLNNQHQLL